MIEAVTGGAVRDITDVNSGQTMARSIAPQITSMCNNGASGPAGSWGGRKWRPTGEACVTHGSTNHWPDTTILVLMSPALLIRSDSNAVGRPLIPEYTD